MKTFEKLEFIDIPALVSVPVYIVSIPFLFRLQYLCKCCTSHAMRTFLVKVVRMLKNNSRPMNIKESGGCFKLFFLCFHLMCIQKVVRLFLLCSFYILSNHFIAQFYDGFGYIIRSRYVWAQLN